MEIIGQGGGPHGGADAFTNILLPPYFRKNHRRVRPPWCHDPDSNVDPDLVLDLHLGFHPDFCQNPSGLKPEIAQPTNIHANRLSSVKINEIQDEIKKKTFGIYGKH